MNIENWNIGADPELFIFNTKENRVISSIGLIPGEKGKPYTKGMPKGYGVEIDNILAEFNIPPVTSCDEFVHHMEYMKNWIRVFVKKKNPDLDILCAASRHIDEDQLQSDEAKLFGCMPDFNCYTEDVNPRPCGETTNLRSVGYHIHVGYDNPTEDQSIKMIKYFDAFVGVPSVLLDNDMERRSLYGKAGSFRFTKYGFEYRVLSGFWLQSETTIALTWNWIENAINAAKDDIELPDSKAVVECINTGNTSLAKEILSRYKF